MIMCIGRALYILDMGKGLTRHEPIFHWIDPMSSESKVKGRKMKDERKKKKKLRPDSCPDKEQRGMTRKIVNDKEKR